MVNTLFPRKSKILTCPLVQVNEKNPQESPDWPFEGWSRLAVAGLPVALYGLLELQWGPHEESVSGRVQGSRRQVFRVWRVRYP